MASIKTNKDYYSRCNPYCFKKMADGRYLGLNRDYLPIDRTRNDVGGYLEELTYKELLENDHKEKGIVLTIKDIKLLKHSGDKDMFWLYRDECAPWKNKKYEADYDKKIETVPALKWLA